MKGPSTLDGAAQRASHVGKGVQAAIVVLIILNLVQLNILSWDRARSRCSRDSCQGTAAAASQPAQSSIRDILTGAAGRATMHGRKALPASSGPPGPDRRFALFVIYSWNYEVLVTSVRSYVEAGLGAHLIILDNSPDRRIVNDEVVRGLAAEVIPTRTRLTFSQSQNFLASVAIERGYDFYFWGHSDVALLSTSANASFGADALECVAAAYANAPDWGVLYFAYDWFSAIRTDLVRQVQYDTFITVYKSDCDFYPRVRAAGYKTLNYPEVCGKAVGKVYDLNNPVEVPWDDWDAAKAALDADEAGGRAASRFNWKFNKMGVEELVGWPLWERASALYFEAKWGDQVDPMEICRIEVRSELTGEEVLPQQPFGSMYHLQRYNWLEPDWAAPAWGALKGSAAAANGSKVFEEYRARALGWGSAPAPAPALPRGDGRGARTAMLGSVTESISKARGSAPAPALPRGDRGSAIKARLGSVTESISKDGGVRRLFS